MGTPLPPPRIEPVGPLLIVRDDLIPGGTKRRVLAGELVGADEFVYASPAYGYAQIALAHACRDVGARATVFVAKRKELHPRTREAVRAGAKVVQVPAGYLTVVQARARAYCEATGAALVPFGVDTPRFRDLLAGVARSLSITAPREVWTVAGSGTLTRALQVAWPDATLHAVQIGKAPDAGRAQLHLAPESFQDDAREPPPFPSCSNYDAKAWQFIRRLASPGALFWNVAA
jgi:hypothetical protein